MSPGLGFHSLTFDVTGKNLRASFTPEHVRQRGVRRGRMLGNVHQEDLLYDPLDGFRSKNTSYPSIVGTLALTCDTHFDMDGNSSWLDWLPLIGVEPRARGPKLWLLSLSQRVAYTSEHAPMRTVGRFTSGKFLPLHRLKHSRVRIDQRPSGGQTKCD